MIPFFRLRFKDERINFMDEIVEYNRVRVLTTQQLAEKYGTGTEIITKNFNRNKDRYFEGKHYICLKGKELKEFRSKGQIDLSIKATTLYLWTEKGALLHAKSLNTDKAWEVYDYLVDSYFRTKETLSYPAVELENDPMKLLELHYKALKEVDNKVDVVSDEVKTVKAELEQFKNDMPILGVEETKITDAVHKRGVEILGGKQSNAYSDRSLRGKLYSDLHRELRRQFGVSTYKAIKRSQCDTAVSIIKNYKPPLALAEQIKNLNAQMNMDMGVA